MKWTDEVAYLSGEFDEIGPNHPYGLPYEKGELMKFKLFVLLSVGVGAGLLARTVFRKRLHK